MNNNIIEILWQKFSDNLDKIEDFFAENFAKYPALFYNSTDLRHSGFKIAPVDTNCFPAGFNNLSEESKEEAKKIALNYLDKHFPDAKRIIILPENHTRNLRYLKNVLDLADILSVNREVIVGSLSEEITEKITLEIDNLHKLELHPLKKENNKISSIDGFEADLLILNNDLTNGIPEILQDLETPITPTINLGWHNRTKTDHFNIYNKLATELSNLAYIDPWLISALHKSCHEVNFKEQKGLDCLAKHVDTIIGQLREKYQKYGINEEPYVYVKADNGTYGMAIWAVSSGQEILEINKKNRNKMNMLKGSIQNTKVMVQEGIRTIDNIRGITGEPMIYMIDGQIVGNLFRVNDTKTDKTSLNSPGADFFDLKTLENSDITLGANKEKVALVYSVIGRLAALAAACELKKKKKPSPRQRPLIGIIPDYVEGGAGKYSLRNFYALRENYFTSISKVGGAAIILPYDYDLIDYYLELLDGIIIVGGYYDINPGRYEENDVHETLFLNKTREDFEFTFGQKALDTNIPFLGICNGMQLLNILRGGSNMQHIPDLKDTIEHEQKFSENFDGYEEPYHEINISEESKLFAIAKTNKTKTNSSHHQAIKDVGKNLVVSARAPDGIIEAIEDPNHNFCLGLQWHPEFHSSEIDKNIFSNFVKKSKEYKDAKSREE